MTNETAADRLAKVDSILKDTYAWFSELREERRNAQPAEMLGSSYEQKTGKMRALAMVIDAFAEAGFEVRRD